MDKTTLQLHATVINERLKKTITLNEADSALSLYAIEEALYEIWNGKIAIKWAWEDIQDYATQQLEIELSEEQAREILEIVLKKHDAEVGVNWRVIQENIEYFLT